MPDDGQLRLRLADLQREMVAVPMLASPFLSPEGSQRLQEAARPLTTHTARPNTPFTWEISRETPVTTKPSNGEYEQKGDNGPHVIGTLNFCWHLRTGPNPVREVYLVDNASTELRIVDSGGVTLRGWQMDIGLKAGPGACFHTQIDASQSGSTPSSWLPVPRLPSFPPTPMSCLELLVGELFQTEWRKRVERETQEMQAWRGIQRERLCSFLRWQLKAIDQTTGSPLMHLKAFPPSDVLLPR
jgi:hypothetical protein